MCVVTHMLYQKPQWYNKAHTRICPSEMATASIRDTWPLADLRIIRLPWQ